MPKTHRNIPIFVPHLGCPHRCVFCDQNTIAGCADFRESEVAEKIETALSTIPSGVETEIAFFGGSFTGIEEGLMLRLLSTAQHYVDTGRVTSIRLSTRPDLISDRILQILSRFAVRHIELGLQSMDDQVLLASGRGHTAEQSRVACRKVVSAGFLLTGQMMVGLPASTTESELRTAEEICALGATSARIYPTVVFRDTELHRMMLRGDYRPLPLDEAVARSAGVLRILESHGVSCIRIGLCASEELTSPEEAVAGANHPALGELVRAECEYRNLIEAIPAALCGREVVLTVPRGRVSAVVGQRRSNLLRLERERGIRVLRVIPTDGDRVTVEPRDARSRNNSATESEES